MRDGMGENPNLDEVYARARGEALREKREHLNKELRFWLFAGVLFFIAALVFKCNNLPRDLPRFRETPAVEVPPPPFSGPELLSQPWVVLPVPK